jgi:arylsulfatase A-like enzyme
MGCHRLMSKDYAFNEPAVRIPMIFRAPGRRTGVVHSDPVSGIDVFPTLCALLGFPQPSGIAGRSLAARWEGGTGEPDRPILAAQGIPGKNRVVMLRTPRYKFARYDDGGNELYDLNRDPGELDNRAGDPEYALLPSPACPVRAPIPSPHLVQRRQEHASG